MRLIDGDALVAKLEADAEEMEDPIAKMFTYAAINDVKHAPTVEPMQWIPCSERMPENIKPVIVTWKNNDPESYYQYIVGKHFIGVAHFKSGKWYWYSSVTEDFLAEYGRYEGEEFDEAIEVIAWCKLPTPYKGGDADGRP